MKITQIKETCLYTRNLESAREFYHGLLELPEISYAPGKHVFFRAGSSVLLCFNPDDSRQKKSPPPHFSEGRYHFAFEVEANDYPAEKQQLEKKGIRIIDSVTWETGQESCYFEDPAGNIVEMVPRGLWG